MIFVLIGIISCGSVDICYGIPPENATALVMNEIPWDSGPEYNDPKGWTGTIYSSQEQWDDFLAENEVESPNFDVDFATSDVVLYERLYNGCNFEVVFDGAYSLDGDRIVRTQIGEFDVQTCDIYENRHAILVIEKVAGSALSFCSPTQ
jgi:hypothetical protein